MTTHLTERRDGQLRLARKGDVVDSEAPEDPSMLAMVADR